MEEATSSSSSDGETAPYPTIHRRSGTAAKLCLAQGCDEVLAAHGKYCVQRRLCPAHLKADCLKRKHHGDLLWRFCQQCGKLEPLTCFDGAKRSCRVQLARRRLGPMRTQSQSNATSQSNAASTASFDVRSLPPARSASFSSLDAWQHQQHELEQQKQALEQKQALLEQQLALLQQHAQAEAELAALQQQYSQLQWELQHELKRGHVKPEATASASLDSLRPPASSSVFAASVPLPAMPAPGQSAQPLPAHAFASMQLPAPGTAGALPQQQAPGPVGVLAASSDALADLVMMEGIDDLVTCVMAEQSGEALSASSNVVLPAPTLWPGASQPQNCGVQPGGSPAGQQASSSTLAPAAVGLVQPAPSTSGGCPWSPVHWQLPAPARHFSDVSGAAPAATPAAAPDAGDCCMSGPLQRMSSCTAFELGAEDMLEMALLEAGAQALRTKSEAATLQAQAPAPTWRPAGLCQHMSLV